MVNEIDLARFYGHCDLNSEYCEFFNILIIGINKNY